MAKLTFRAEARIPKQVVLPLKVANPAGVPRVLVLEGKSVEADEAVTAYLQERYPRWFETKQGKGKTTPKDEPPEETPAEAAAVDDGEASADEAEGKPRSSGGKGGKSGSKSGDEA